MVLTSNDFRTVGVLMQSGVGIGSIEQSEDLSEAMLVLDLTTSHVNSTYDASVRSARHLARPLGSCPSRFNGKLDVQLLACMFTHTLQSTEPCPQLRVRTSKTATSLTCGFLAATLWLLLMQEVTKAVLPHLLAALEAQGYGGASVQVVTKFAQPVQARAPVLRYINW